MVTKTTVLVRACGPLLVPFAAFAHHSPSMFDGSKQLTLTGTVREFQWSNPHSYIQLVVKAADGTEQEWSLEMGANAYLYNLGWRPSTVKPGDILTVKVEPLRLRVPPQLLSEAKVAHLRRLLADHPGESPVLLQLGERRVVRLPERWNVDASNGLVGQLREALGPTAILG